MASAPMAWTMRKERLDVVEEPGGRGEERLEERREARRGAADQRPAALGERAARAPRRCTRRRRRSASRAASRGARRSDEARPDEGGEKGCGASPARARAARGACTRSAVRAATDTVSLSARGAGLSSAGRLDVVRSSAGAYATKRRQCGHLKPRFRSVSPSRGPRRPAAVRAVDREGSPVSGGVGTRGQG